MPRDCNGLIRVSAQSTRVVGVSSGNQLQKAIIEKELKRAKKQILKVLYC